MFWTILSDYLRQLVRICLITAILLDTKTLGDAFEECEEFQTLDCIWHRGNTFNCIALASIHGDSCTILDTKQNRCGDVQNVSANHEVELSRKDSLIYMMVHCTCIT